MVHPTVEFVAVLVFVRVFVRVRVRGSGRDQRHILEEHGNDPDEKGLRFVHGGVIDQAL